MIIFGFVDSEHTGDGAFSSTLSVGSGDDEAAAAGCEISIGATGGISILTR